MSPSKENTQGVDKPSSETFEDVRYNRVLSDVFRKTVRLPRLLDESELKINVKGVY
jgi:hypothetical protein